MKRKQSPDLEDDSKKTKSSDQEPNAEAGQTPDNDYLDSDSPRDVFQKFIGAEMSVDAFLNEYWEKKPYVFKRSEDSAWLRFVGDLFTLEKLKSLLKKTKNEFVYARDINLCRLIDGKKKNLNKTPAKNKKPVAKLDDVTKAFEKDKATIQFHQPQRFSDELWKLQEKLECFFGNLVGSNIYITPNESQGLAPHYDDIEAFVVQLEGSKHWKLYAPIDELPNVCSPDLSEEQIKEPTHDFVLNPGDVLYFPRGIIHQASTPQSTSHTHSTHITISTYQNFNKMEFLTSIAQEAIRAAFEKNVGLRQGLPIGFLKGSDYNKVAESALKDLSFDPKDCFPTDLMQDFMSERLPPFTRKQNNLSKLALLQDLNEKLKVRLSFPDHVLASVDFPPVNEDSEEDEEDEEEDEESPEKKLLVFYSHMNNRENHMISSEINATSNCLKLDPKAYEAIESLIKKRAEWTNMNELQGSLNDKELLKTMLVSLFVENIIEVEQSD